MDKQGNTHALASSSGNSDVEVATYTEAEERRVLQKIDRVVLPLLCTVYFFQYLDKQAVGYAAVFGLQTDLNMDSNEYSWVVSIFYLGQLVSEYFFIYLMTRMPIARFVGIMILIWGVVAGCLAAPQSFAGFAVVRFILGACEGAVSPAFVVITSSWYKQREHPIRVAAWVSFNSLASIVGAILMYGIGLAQNVALANWRIMFLICAGATMCCGGFFIWLMPEGPENAWFLTEAERAIACQRLRNDGITRETRVFKKSQIIEALTDPFCWFAVLFGFLGTFASPVLKACPCIIVIFGLYIADPRQFASLVINGFGWSKFNTMLVGLPSGALQIIFIWVTVLGMRHTKIPRCYWGMAVTVLPLVGNIGIMCIPLTSKWGIVIFTWFSTIISPVMVISLSLMASNIKGNTKKSAVSNGYFILYGGAAVAAPQLWQTQDSPRYKRGVTADIICFGCIIVLFLSYRILVLRENARRDRLEGSNGQLSDSEMADATDKEDVLFRYVS